MDCKTQNASSTHQAKISERGENRDSGSHIRMVHSATHIEMAARQAHEDSICRLAVSGALSAVDAVCSGEVRNAFCAIRPPGHHAADKGEFGFCRRSAPECADG